MEKPASNMCLGADGYVRPRDQEDSLNKAFASLFAKEGGEVILNYLKGITLNTVVPHSESPERLRHQEGMRDLFRIIQERILKGKEGKNDDTNRNGTSTNNGPKPRRKPRLRITSGRDSTKPAISN